MDYSQYYGEIAREFDVVRLDADEEIQLACGLLLSHRQPPGELLEIGCGTGRYGARLRAAGYRVTGVDVSQAQLDHARGLDQTVCASATDLPFAASSFDVCAMILMIQQLGARDRGQAFREVVRVLRSEGVLCLKTCSHEDLDRRPLQAYFPSGLRVNRARYPDIPTLREELADAGLVTQAVQPTETTRTISVSALIHSIERKHNTTLALIPPREFDSGLARLRHDLVGESEVSILHPHTLVFATPR